MHVVAEVHLLGRPDRRLRLLVPPPRLVVLDREDDKPPRVYLQDGLFAILKAERRALGRAGRLPEDLVLELERDVLGAQTLQLGAFVVAQRLSHLELLCLGNGVRAAAVTTPFFKVLHTTLLNETNVL